MTAPLRDRATADDCEPSRGSGGARFDFRGRLDDGPTPTGRDRGDRRGRVAPNRACSAWEE